MSHQGQKKKRTESINLDRMRKTSAKDVSRPVFVTVAASTLVACGDSSQEAIVYQDVEDCIRDNPGLTYECQTAYQKALDDAVKSGPKYQTERECRSDFGPGMCVPYNGTYSGGNDWFVPAMAGFMFSQFITSNNSYGYHSYPLYTSYSRYSPYYGHWTSVDGRNYGRIHYGKIRVPKSTFKPKPKVTKTMSRGGFGSKVAAKSNWGGSSSRKSSWGG